MRRFNDPSSFSPLLFGNLLMQLLHFRPVQFGSEMMFRVIPVVEPERIVDLFVRAHTPGNRFIRITAEMEEIPVQIGEAVP
jgi:hypothetical protein